MICNNSGNETLYLLFKYGGHEINICIDLTKDGDGYVVWDRSSGHGYCTLSDAIQEVKRSYPTYKFTGIKVSNHTELTVSGL